MGRFDSPEPARDEANNQKPRFEQIAQITAAALNPKPQQEAAPQYSGSALSRFVDATQDSYKYTLVQGPVTGVSQLVDFAAGTRSAETTKFMDRKYERTQMGSAEWFGNVVGGVGAAATHMAILYRMTGPGAAAKFETSYNYGLSPKHLGDGLKGSIVDAGRLDKLVSPQAAAELNKLPRLSETAAPYLAKSVATGAVYGGVFTPTSGDDKNFVSERLINSAVYAVSFGTQTAAALKLKTMGSPMLARDPVAGLVSGAVSGEINADMHSLLTHGTLASWGERAEAVAASALGGGLGGGLNQVHERLKPTNGIVGVRTFNDAMKLADSTKVENPPARHAFEQFQKRPPTADEILQWQGRLEWDKEIIANMRVQSNESGLPVPVMKDVLSDTQASLITAQWKHNNQQKLMTIWGSARLPDTDFSQPITRYIGGRAAHEGYAVQTGGGDSGMKNGNQGAYEAGGRSIGVLIKLQFEQGQAGNGYQTETYWHRNFGTRKAQLRASDVFVLTKGGLGSLDELFDKATHSQTGKEPNAPIYVQQPYYEYTLKQVKQFVKDGTASQSDVDRLIPFRDPRHIFEDLKRREAAANNPPATHAYSPWLTRLLTGRRDSSPAGG